MNPVPFGFLFSSSFLFEVYFHFELVFLTSQFLRCFFSVSFPCISLYKTICKSEFGTFGRRFLVKWINFMIMMPWLDDGLNFLINSAFWAAVLIKRVYWINKELLLMSHKLQIFLIFNFFIIKVFIVRYIFVYSTRLRR